MHAKADLSLAMEKSEVLKGFAIGQPILCPSSLDPTQLYVADIIDRRECNGKIEFYVHYRNLDRRLDRWASDKELRVYDASAESEAALKHEHPALSPLLSPNGRRSIITRREKRKINDIIPDSDPSDQINMDGIELALEKEHCERTKIKNIEKIQLGQFLIDTWYFSPFPEEYRSERKLFFCEFCLKYMKKQSTYVRHRSTCMLKHPPGTEIYRDKQFSVFEVDGAREKIYCQCLCLLAKLFIDHKTLYYDVEPFLFYILCVFDKQGYHIAGYFSKEKQSLEAHNLACILTFPQYQRRGFGMFLIEMSYEISKLEGKIGSPEKPLSDLGKVSYRSYWTRVLLSVLSDQPNLTINDLSLITSIKKEDIICTLQRLDLVKYLKGQQVVSVTPKLLAKYEEVLQKKPRITLSVDKIQWSPPEYVFLKNNDTSSSPNSSNRVSISNALQRKLSNATKIDQQHGAINSVYAKSPILSESIECKDMIDDYSLNSATGRKQRAKQLEADKKRGRPKGGCSQKRAKY